MNILDSKNKRSIAKYAIVMFFSALSIFSAQDVLSQENDSSNLSTVKLGDKEYSLGIVSIAKNSSGNILVKVDGSESGKSYKFWQVATTGGKVYNVRPSVGVDIISNGKTVSANGYTIEEDGMEVSFPTKVQPTSVVFFSVDNRNLKVTFSVKTKKPVN